MSDKKERNRDEIALSLAKLALVYIADNTLDKWSRLKANEALTRIRELQNA